ncbi:hypothetical protein NHX12_007748 [Muraenolepis orangiensis]|uniref:Uncharacterized protein n=1 Tax=Muraenolepis orangiensis TaxID=630683 RepID=A0A9Q0DS06_9TELE|nr:hypothetical protein NHX12_007748 [Muraenolepis orangiensis]
MTAAGQSNSFSVSKNFGTTNPDMDNIDALNDSSSVATATTECVWEWTAGGDGAVNGSLDPDRTCGNRSSRGGSVPQRRKGEV